MRVRFSVVATALLLLAGEARADKFGGFSRDESRYLRGSDQICEPFPAGKTASGFPACERAALEKVAAMGFRKGTVQSAATARYKVSVRKGSAICLVDVTSGKKAAGWTSVDLIARVAGVQLSQNGRLVAVEYEARVGGRLVTDVVVFAVPVSGAGAPTKPGVEPGAAHPDAPAPVVKPAVPDPTQNQAQAHVERAWKLVEQRKYAEAEALFEKALALDEWNPEARYGLAVTLARRGQKDRAIAELEKLARSARPETVVWRVEARFDKAFRKMLANTRFRKAVGLDVAAGVAQTAYERLVGTGGHWEQAGTPCDRARVNLKLQRRPRKFELRVRTRCHGMDETTTLEGAWAWSGTGALELSFPNEDGPEEVMRCGLAVCPDGSGEDCLTCAAGTDMEMKFRVVRR